MRRLDNENYDLRLNNRTKKMGFLQDLIDDIKYKIFKNRDPELEARIARKDLRERLKNHKYKFIDFENNMITPEFAKYMYKIYIPVDPLLKMLKTDFVDMGGRSFATALIHARITEDQLKMLDEFSKETIQNKIMKSGNANAVFEQTKEKFNQFQKIFTPELSKAINKSYNTLKTFAELTKFDFFMFLKTFDESLPEANPSYKPLFKPKDSKFLIDDLIKVDCALASTDVGKELLDAIIVYKTVKDAKHLDEKKLKNVLLAFKYLKNAEILSDMIKYLSEDMSYQPVVEPYTENITKAFINNIAQQLKSDMDSIVKAMKNNKIEKAKKQLFKDIKMLPMNNYSKEKNTTMAAGGYPTFQYPEIMEALKTFIIEIYEREKKDIINQIIISAEYAAKEKETTLADGFFMLNKVRQKIIEFDKNLDEESEEGKRLRAMLVSKKNNKDLVNNLVLRADEKAEAILKEAIEGMDKLSKQGKEIIEDCDNNTKNAIFNAKSFQGTKNLQMFREIVKDVGLFLSLAKNYIS